MPRGRPNRRRVTKKSSSCCAGWRRSTSRPSADTRKWWSFKFPFWSWSAGPDDKKLTRLHSLVASSTARMEANLELREKEPESSAPLVPMSYAEKAMASLMRLHGELMDEKERRVDLYRRLMEKDQAVAELRMYVSVLEEKLADAQRRSATARPSPAGFPGR